MATSAIKLSDYEDESVYNDDGVNGGLPSSSRGGSLMEGRTALSPPPPPIPPRARSRSRSAPKEAAPAPPPAAEAFPFAPENPVLPAPTPITTTAASVLLSPFPPRPKSIRTGVGTGPVKLRDRQNSGDEAMGVGYAVSYNSAIPPPPVRAAPPAPKWAPPTIPGYEDDAKPLSSSGFKLDDPPPSGAAAAANKGKTGSNNRNNRLSIFPGPSPSPTPSTQGWSSSPLSSPSTPPVPAVPTDRLEASEHGSQHKRGGSGGTAEEEAEEENEQRGRPSQKRQQQSQTRARGSSVTGQSPSPAPTLEAWLKRGMSSTRVPVRRGTETETGIVAGPGASPSSLPRSASTSNLAAVRRQSYTARLREQVQQRYMLDADDGGRGEDWPIRQS
ncbi:uncharacterized protein B0T23DRAFT_382125 [Neurospora hispaniola]|uniref:Uncharacterized protein n=1 Tax=Neurospora hispaniola TaxID=588809 RepID=A0AAJ0I5F7_9PEZI|nr:hypothetical protein B0T23DRAFT_382125 [Neurospora hispaniola]